MILRRKRRRSRHHTAWLVTPVGRSGSQRRSRRYRRRSVWRKLILVGCPGAVLLGLQAVASDLDYSLIDLPAGDSRQADLPGVTEPVGGGASDDADFTRRFYVGASLGVTRLRPESVTPSLTVSDDTDSGYSLTLGYDFARWLSFEAYVADLGGAEISFIGDAVGEVEYQNYGAGAVFWLYNRRSGLPFSNSTEGLFRREGLSLYARAGIGGLRNDSELDYRRDHASHVSAGLGLEYGFRNGFALRTEIAGYDTDARMLSAGLVKRFGKVREALPVAAVAATRAIEPPETAPKAVAPPPPETSFYFKFGQADLTPRTQRALDAYATAAGDTDTSLSIEGNTDWVDTEAYNYALSVRRANAVRRYLLQNGVGPERMQVVGYGETRPVASNETEEGRARNRRVEIVER